MGLFCVSYSELCKELINCNNNVDLLTDFIKTKNMVLTINEIQIVKKSVQNRFLCHFFKRWAESRRNKSYFFKKNYTWLKNIFEVSLADEQPSCSTKMGRPAKEFGDCADRSKRYKAADLASQYSKQHLEMASALAGSNLKSQSYIPPATALALLLDAELTKYQYETIKYVLHKEGYNILPPYAKVLDEKKKCYPSEVKISEKEASVNLQSLMDHTTKRLFESFSHENINNMVNLNCTLMSKWGCDGSSGHSEYNQSLVPDVTDKNLLLVSMVPLSLRASSEEEYWRNRIR